jgi:hypothetical protein
VAGDPFEPELAAAAADVSETAAIDAIDELLALDFVRETAVSAPAALPPPARPAGGLRAPRRSGWSCSSPAPGRSPRWAGCATAMPRWSRRCRWRRGSTPSSEPRSSPRARAERFVGRHEAANARLTVALGTVEPDSRELVMLLLELAVDGFYRVPGRRCTTRSMGALERARVAGGR